MRASDVLTAWEQGRALTPTGRGESMLDAFGVAADGRESLTVGQRDALLLTLRRQMFGSEVFGVASCPECGVQLDVTFDIDDVWQVPPGDPAQPADLMVRDFTVRAHAPTTSDLLALDLAPRGADRRQLMLHRCIEHASHDGVEVEVEDLPDAVIAEVVERLQSVDPQADVQLALRCAGCGHGWSVTFDILSYLWVELGGRARSLVRDVHVLASAYGWRQDDIAELQGRCHKEI